MAAIRGVGGAALLRSYELERRPAAVRNTAFARGFAESLGGFTPQAGLEDDGATGDRVRREAGAYLARHGREEFDIPGITFGTRYEGSPVIVADGSTAPPDAANTYVPSASPGGRAPHLWLDEGRSLFDCLGLEWSLLRLGSDAPAGEGIIRAARGCGIGLTVVDVPPAEARELYEAPLALITPDQVVAWRGADDADAATIVEAVTGRASDRVEVGS